MKLTNVFRSRINLNKNVMLGVVGDTGEGKSYLSLLIGSRMDKSFDIDRDIGFSVTEYLRIILRKNLVCIFDDAGAAINSRRWRDELNQLVADTAQTYRFMNKVNIFTMPHLGLIDYQVRSLFHFVIWKDKQNSAVVYRVSTDHLSGKVYFKRIGLLKNIPLPDEDLIVRYEERRKEFMLRKYRENLERAMKIEKQDAQYRYIEILQENMDQVIDSKTGKIVTAKIAALLDCSYNKALILKQKLENLIQKEVVV